MALYFLSTKPINEGQNDIFKISRHHCCETGRGTVFKIYTAHSLPRIVRTTRIPSVHQTRKPQPNGQFQGGGGV